MDDERAPNSSNSTCTLEATSSGNSEQNESDAHPSREEEDARFCQRLATDDPTAYALGMERNRSAMRQLGGLLVILGMGAAHSAIALTAVIIEGMGGYNQVDGFKLPILCSTTIQIVLGMTSMAVGFYTLLATPLSRHAQMVANMLLVVVNLGPISFIITVVRIAQGANEPPEDNVFIPPSLHPPITQTHIRFVVAMGILGLTSVCASLIGGLTVVGLSLKAHLAGQIVDKHQGYYIVRFGYYSILQFLGGASQFSLGIFLAATYGAGPYDEPVHVAVYTVFFPAMTIFVGLIQTLHGVYGFCRATGCCWAKTRNSSDSRFLLFTLIAWIVTMVLQCIVQPSYGEGMSFIAEGATYAAVYIGNFVMPAWLENLVRTTPRRIDRRYYSLPESTLCKEDFLCKVFQQTEGKDDHRAAAEGCSSVALSATARTSQSDLELGKKYPSLRERCVS